MTRPNGSARTPGHVAVRAAVAALEPPPAAQRRRRQRDRGSVTLETAIIAPALIVLLLLVIAVGRVGKANTTVDSAAFAAARAASISRTASQARTEAAAAANSSLNQQGLTCAGLRVSVDTSQFAVRAGQPAVVTADIECTVPLEDLAVPGLGGSRTLSGHAVSSIDTYRQRTP